MTTPLPDGGALAKMKFRTVTAVLLLGVACGAGASATRVAADDDTPSEVPSIALVGVHVIPMDRDVVLRDRTVLIRDGKISRIGPVDRVDVPGGVWRPDVQGRYVIPGLFDMHVHLSRDDLEAYLAAGVTTVRNMWGWSEIAAIRRDLASGAVRGPRVFSAGPAVDGDPPVRAGSEVVTDPAKIAPLVQRQKAAGWEFVKVYQNVDREVFAALARAAAANGMPLIGHVPTAVPFDEAVAGMASIEHLEGYDKALTGSRRRGFRSWLDVEPGAADAVEMNDLAQTTAATETWNCPTLVVAKRALGNRLSASERERAVSARRAMVRVLRDAGASLLAGTDGGVPVVPPGAIAEELVELGRAGLTPYEALRAATIDAARFLGATESLGRVAEGTVADLLLLSDNPLEDLGVTRDPIAVVANGEWIVPDRTFP